MRNIILVSPSSSLLKGDKHLELLYRVLKKHGYHIYPFSFMKACRYNRRAIWHIHWIDMFHIGVIRRVRMRKQFAFISSLRFVNFLFLLIVCKLSGINILWTIHNVASHRNPGGFFERAVIRLLLNVADEVTALNENTKRAICELYGFHEIDLMRQGLYERCYADTVTQEKARKYLGLDEEAFVLLCLGRIEEYKGIDIAIEALEMTDDGVKLVVAGSLDRGSRYGAYVVRLAEKNKNVLLFDRFIPDDEMQFFFRAADYTIYPYRRIDNSGPLYLTLTFGIPTIMRGAGGVLETLKLNPGVAIVIDDLEIHTVAEAIKKARTMRIASEEFVVYKETLNWASLEQEIMQCFNKVQQ